MKKSVVTLFIALTVIGIVYPQTYLQPIAEVKLSSRVLITLGNIKVCVSALEKGIGRKMTVAERQQILDSLINRLLIIQAAEIEGIQIMDSEVSKYFNEYVSYELGLQVSEADFPKQIKEKTNMSIDQYKKVLAYVIQKKQKELQSIPNPTDKQIRSYYEENRQYFVQPDMVKLFLVLVPNGEKASTAEKIMKDVQKKLTENPKDIARIRTKSHEKNSGYQAGEIFVTKTALAAEQLGISMEELIKIFNMKVGEVSPICETAINYQCFVVMEKKASKILELNDAVEPGKNVSLYEYIKKRMIIRHQNEALYDALVSVSNELRRPENFVIFKTGTELEKKLSW